MAAVATYRPPPSESSGEVPCSSPPSSTTLQLTESAPQPRLASHRRDMKPLQQLLSVVAVFVSWLLLPLSIDAAGGRLQWEILSAHNFSSQINSHPHVLVFVTVPWCGESRSLMKELSHKLSNKREKVSSIKLMVVFSNQDQVLAESFGTEQEITVFLYQYGTRYKYTGRLSARDIQSSASYLMSLMPDDLPLTTLDTSDDLEKFVTSTDKAVLLLDSCGWARRLLAQHNGSVTAQGISGGDSARGLNVDAKQTILSEGQKNVEALRSEKLKCGIDYGFGGIPWVREFSSYNEVSTSMETDLKLSEGSSCTVGDYQKFASFFSKFIPAARDMFLPPQRQRYGLVSNSSLLSSLGLESFDVWSLIVYYAGCPNCLKVLEDERNLQVAMEMQSLPLMELDGAGMDAEPAFLMHEPSVVLFVDRFAHSVEVKRRSADALSAFKEAALQYKNSFQKGVQKTDCLRKPPVQTYKESTIISGESRKLLSPLSHKIKLKDRKSVMIVNEGAHANLDNTGSTFQGNSLREILTQLLGQKKQGKLSLLAKEVGFQLLSDDININIIDDSSHTGSHSVSTSTNPSLENPRISGDDSDTNNDLTSQSSSLEDHEKLHDLPLGKLSNNLNEEAIQDHIDIHSSCVNSQQLSEEEAPVSADAHSEKQTYIGTDQVVKKLHQSEGFAGSFFFSDGNYQLLDSLTGESKVPRMVIIEPISQMHYVSPQRKDFSYLSISHFINRVSNGSLPPHQRSAKKHLQKHVEAPRPPFVNLDFHEKDPIPSLATNRFTELVLGSSSLATQNASNAWNEDVLVLFSNSWCGFCQRMDLLVQEVYRSLKSYMDLVIDRPKNKKAVIANDSLKAVMLKLPMIYRIDCTRNDCSWILKSVDQRELYPSLMLFPAKWKTALPYDGDMAVNSIINFIAKHGSSSFHLVQQKSGETEHQNLVKDIPPMANHHESSDACQSFLSDHIQQKQVSQIQTVGIPVDEKTLQYSILPGALLIATEKLSGVNPFSNARILIFSANKNTGFQGLITNKHISQESRAELGLPELLKETTVFFGGPVVNSALPLTAMTKKQIEGQNVEVLPGVYFLDQSATLGEIEKLKTGLGSVADYWFFLGYSGWGWDQLFDEISQGAWRLEDGNDKHFEIKWP